MGHKPKSVSKSRQLWILRAVCFIQFFATGIMWSYQTVWMKEQGVGEFFIGQVQAISTVLTLVTGIVYGYLADVTGRPNRIMILGTFLAGATLFYLSRCTERWHFIVYALMAGVSMPMVLNMLPLMALSIVEGGKAGRKYGTYRVFGSLGYSISTLLLPRVIGSIGPMLHVAAMAMVLAVVPALLLATPRRTSHKHGRLRPVLRNRELMGFFAAMFFFGLAAPAVFQFTPTYARELGADDKFIGLLGAMLGLVSLISLPSAGPAVDRYGPRLLLTLALLAMPLRVLALSFVDAYTYMLLPRLLHMFTFGALEVAAVLYVSRLAGPQSRGTAMSVYAGANVLARALGSPLAGYLAEEFSYPLMYRASAVASSVGLVLFVAMNLRSRRKRREDGDASRQPAV